MSSAPQDLAAEESVLGAMLVSPRAIDDLDGVVSASDFYRESHGTLFDLILELHHSGVAIDPVIVNATAEERGVADRIGGSPRIAELVALCTSTSNAAHHGKIVREKAVLRGLLHAGLSIQELATKGVGSASELRDQAEQLLSEGLLASSTTLSGSVNEGLEEWLAEIREAYKTKQPIVGQPTYISALDQALGGFWPGQLVILAARPAVGKTTFAVNVADNLADVGKPVLYGSLEMSRGELRIKSLSRLAEIDSLMLQSGLINEEQAQRLTKALEIQRKRSQTMLVLDNTFGLPDLRAEATRIHRQRGLGLIVVDYLQLMSGHGRADTRAEEVGQISRGLKQIAVRLQVPVLALSQMNRAIEARGDKRPTLSDLRESGSLEQDADVVLFLHDAADYDPDKEKDGTIELVVAKARRGSAAPSINLAYNRSWSKFMSMSGPSG